MGSIMDERRAKPIGPRPMRGRHRHDVWIIIAAVAMWGVVTGSLRMRPDGPARAWDGPVAERIVTPVNHHDGDIHLYMPLTEELRSQLIAGR